MAHKVLVIDDEPVLLQTVRPYLEQEGYDVRTALDGRAALQEALAFEPDLIVPDVMLPGVDGLEVLRRLRSGDAGLTLRAVYVIMLTARADEVDRVLGLELGADDYVAKPFSPRELAARFKASLESCSHECGSSSPIVQRGTGAPPQLQWEHDHFKLYSPLVP